MAGAHEAIGTRGGQRRRARAGYAVAGVATLAAACCVSFAALPSTAGASGHGAGHVAQGGTLTVLENGALLTWPNGLNPLTNENAEADQTIEDAVFGELFELGAGGKTIPDLASGYHLSKDGKTLVVDVRKGVTFSDGTRFDAQAVAYNFKEDLASSCTCKPTWQVAAIGTPGPYTVVIHLKVADGAIINQFQDSIVNWMVSPTALRKESATAFAAKPVGAGPFIIETNTPNSRIVLRRNPHYWQKGHPYLDQLIFQDAANDESALEDLRSGTGQAYESMTTPGLVPAFKRSGYTVTAQPSTSPYAVQLNTLTPPFNNLLAREALYYATNASLLDKKLNNDAFPVTESFTAPTGLFYEPKVPGYRTYDLTKAQAIVKRLGGLRFTLLSGAGSQQQLATALQAMYEQAGMNVTLSVVTLTQLIQDLESHNWNASLTTIGTFDPAGSFGLAFRYLGGFPFSGVDDPHLDALMAAGASSVAYEARARIYKEIAQYVSEKAYSPFLYPSADWNVAKKGVSGPGLTSVLPVTALAPEIPWEDVSINNG
jgi:peptide/nickel transport system substrate-binding protein